MKKQKLNNLPNSIAEYGHNHQIWTDRDVALFVSIALVIGFVVGWAV
jgi:hypothetical protein